MYNDNDWRAYLEHGWGKKPEQKAKEKAYNAKYYKEHPEKWGKKEESINKPKSKSSWDASDQKPFDLLSEKYGVNYGRLKLNDPKVLLIAISEATNQRRSLNVFDKAAKELAIEMAKDASGSFKFNDFFKRR